MVEVDLGGTVFPAFIDEIEHPYLKWFTEKSPGKKGAVSFPNIEPEKPPERKMRLATGVYLSFLPVFKTEEMEERVNYLKVFLLNEMPVDIHFNYESKVKQETTFSLSGRLLSFGSIYLHNISYDDMNEQPRFIWKITQEQAKEPELAEGVLRIKPLKLYEHITAILEGRDSSFSYCLAEKLKPALPVHRWNGDLPVAPKVAKTGAVAAKHSAQPIIDLHIETLIGSTRGLTNTDIIHVQIRALQQSMDAAIANRQEMLIVIHGLGKGTLRDEVHKILKQTPEVSKFKNEWSGKYGFGATEVWFKIHS